MKKILLLLLVAFTITQDATAQKKQNPLKGKYRRFSVGVSGGIPVVYSDIKNKFIGYDVTARFNWNITSAVSIGTELGLGFVKGEDKSGEFFSNKYSKALIGGEVYFFNLFRFNEICNWLQPYAGYNIGAIKSDIEKSQSSFHYNDWAFAQQFNAGLKFKLTNMIDLNISSNLLLAGTDRLDNYQPKVYNNNNKDAIMTYRAGLTFHFGKKQNKSIIWRNVNNLVAVKDIDVAGDSLTLYTQAKLFQLENKIATLEAQNRNLQGKVNSKKVSNSGVVQLGARVDKIENAVSDLKTEVSNLGTVSSNAEATIYFGTSSDNIPANELYKLNEVVSLLNNNTGSVAVVSGYTDKRGDAQFNQVLSEKRANSVRDYLLSKGVSASRIEAIGYGENHLLPSSDQGNRRVVVTFR